MNFCFKSCILFLLCISISGAALAHIPKFATITPSQSNTTYVFGLPVNGVINKNDAAVNDNNYAEVYSAVGDAWLQLKYLNVLDPGTTSFIRIESLNHTLQSVINNELTVEVYNNSSSSSNGTLVATPTLSIVQDQNYTYLAVTPSVQYNSVRIVLSTQSVQIPAYWMRVYYSMYNYSDGADCGKGWAANIGEKSMGAAAASNVQNPGRVIDNSASTFSTLQLATNQQNLEVSQTIFFPSTSYIANAVLITASISSAFNAADYTVEVQAYHGLTPKGSSQDISSALTAVNAPIYIYIDPGSFLDRIKITIKAKSNGTQSAHINLHDVQLVPSAPTLSQSNISTCNSSVNLQVSNPDPAVEYRWYSNNQLISGAIGSSYTGNWPSSGSPYAITVAAVKPGCAIESKKATASVTINPKPLTPYITAN